MSIIKFCLLYLYGIIINNPFKIVLCILIIISWHFAGSYSSTKNEIPVLDSIRIQNKVLYLYEEIKDNKKEYKLLEKNDEIKLVNNKVIYYTYNSINVLLWISFGILSLIMFIMLLMALDSDNSTGWDLKKSFDYALSWFIKCYKEDNGYHYYVFGKLLSTSNWPNNARHQPDIGSFRRLRSLPDYEPTQLRRDRIINKLV